MSTTPETISPETPPSETVTAASPLSVSVEWLSHVNFALVQNGYPILRNLQVENSSEETLRNVVCSFASEGGLVVPWQFPLGDIPPHGKVVRAQVNEHINQRRIQEVRGDSQQDSIRMEISADGAPVFQQDCAVTVLAVDQWIGPKPYPELLSAFVLPNADFVNRLQAEAASAIERQTGRSSLEGYQSGKKRTLEICAAVYEAVQQAGIRYCNPPVSFADPGQKIRLPDTIDKFKLGTCIETSLLLAAVLEKCQLHPVLVLTRNHCYVGCHLVEEMCEGVVVRKAQDLRKRADLDEFVAIETTLATGDAPFSHAERTGRAHLDEDEEFLCAIDVVRSRESGIRPLALESGAESDYQAEGRTVSAETGGDVRDLKDSVDLEELRQTQTAQGRIERWTQKLLDLSARNRLLNIPRKSRQVVPLLCSDLARLEDRIAANDAIAIRSIEETMGAKALDDLLNGRLADSQCREIVDAELEHRRLCVMMPAKEVRKRMSDLYHEARTQLEESGVNTLFLTIGVLQWLEPGTGADRKAYRAPILMVPVRLERPSMAEGVKMLRRDEDTAVNTTLVELLRAMFGLTVPGLDSLPTDGSGVDVTRILQIFREAVKSMEGWEVLDQVHVGSFSFGKFVMWKDMTERADELKQNKLVSHLIGGGGSFDDGIEAFPADEVAAHVDPANLFCPVGYDSSQLAAILYSEMGKTFVLHGPPGTGKSQTITNIIAHNLALGRRVLFVSEKKAALDVVKTRLDRIGLTPFCMELHSNKTEKSRFYAQIKEALDVPETSPNGEWDQVAASLESSRAELDAYVQDLHRAYPNGLSAYHCLSLAIQHGTDTPPVPLELDCLTQPQAEYRECGQCVQDLVLALRGVSHEALAKTPALALETWSPVAERQFRAAVQALLSAAQALRTPLRSVAEALSVKGPLSGSVLKALSGTLEALKKCEPVPKRFLEAHSDTPPTLLSTLLSLRARHLELEKALSSYRLDRIADIDWDGVKRRLDENGRKFFLARFFRNRALTKELQDIVRPGSGKLTVARLKSDLPSLREHADLGADFAKKAGHGPDELVEVPASLRDAASDVLRLWPEFQKRCEESHPYVEPSAMPDDVDGMVPFCEDLSANLGELRGVILFRKTEARARTLGLGAFAAHVVEHAGDAADFPELFEDVYAAKMLDAILAQSPALSGFSGEAREERIARFRQFAASHSELSRQIVYARLAATLPRRRGGIVPEGTELGALKRECEKKSRQKAVRQMLAESTTILPVLKPCFLMSPLSVAQYLPVGAAFDLVVFDEASQIPVWDAIGVIARGKQLIVVGDPKQMPPTTFFQKGDMDGEDDLPEDEEVIADQESILDECLVAGVDSTYLNWHYRSRHESLIAFSNEHYYANRLSTFPSASNAPRLGVVFKFVEGGVFERPGSGSGPRVNPTEAKALVDYLCEVVHRPGYRPRSVGVVTFSLPQQRLVRTMLEERRGADPLLEKLLPEEGEDAYFVKNLENVQGDERDVILFSIGYAPDENGRFTMNFGPLNLTGGERRLNVAVTRAREQVVVFSSIHATQIDAGEDGRTKAVGSSHLKAFLEYAERGGPAASAAPSDAARERFADVVSAFLEEKGYAVVRDVGCSGQRIDIAVRHPDDQTRYLAGIECDGPTYAQQRTALDRDVNRDGVLRGLGWRMCRVWSVDWAFDRSRAEERLLKRLEEIRNEPEETPPPPPSAPEPEPQTEPEFASAPVQSPAPTAPAHPVYAVWTPTVTVSRDAFDTPHGRRALSRMLAEVLATEGPVCESVLYRRVGKACGVSRFTEAAQRALSACLPANAVKTEHGDRKVFWPNGTNPSDYRDFRVPADADPDTRRLLEEIPPEELANAMCEVLTDLGGCHRDDLYRETLRLLGLQTLTSKARALLDIAFRLLQNSGRV